MNATVCHKVRSTSWESVTTLIEREETAISLPICSAPEVHELRFQVLLNAHSMPGSRKQHLFPWHAISSAASSNLTDRHHVAQLVSLHATEGFCSVKTSLRYMSEARRDGATTIPGKPSVELSSRSERSWSCFPNERQPAVYKRYLDQKITAATANAVTGTCGRLETLRDLYD